MIIDVHQKTQHAGKARNVLFQVIIGLILASCSSTVQEAKQKAEIHRFFVQGRYDRLGECYLKKMKILTHAGSIYNYGFAHGFHNPIKKMYRVTTGTNTIYGINPDIVTEFYSAGRGRTKIVYYRPKPVIDLGGDVVSRIRKQLADCPK